MPASVEVFGYPFAERKLKGVWREFAVGGPTAASTVQLHWTRDAGSLLGHSGGPVVDSVEYRPVGILIEGSEPGQFDRFLPVTMIARVWPDLWRPSLITGVEQGGAEQAAARSHFTRRARGQRSATRGGDLFRGRLAALAAIRAWLSAEEPPGRALTVTGQPGAGKLAVLARVALALETAQIGPGLAFHARAATAGDFLAAVSDMTGVQPPRTADQLADACADLPEHPPDRGFGRRPR
jgi:hypothetical protein